MVRNKDLSLCSITEIENELNAQNVIDIKESQSESETKPSTQTHTY